MSYDDLGQVISIQYPFDIHVTDWTRPTIWRGYRNGSLRSVDGWATLSYHPNGMVASVVHGSGMTDTWQADPHSMARPRTITTTAGGIQLWTTGAYGFDGAGNISSIGTTRYGYDAFGRLAGWTEEPVPGAARRRRIDYDTFGNQLSFSLQSCIAAGTCTTTGTMNREITNAVSNQYADTTYDASGNVTQDVQGRTYTYDAVNMPKSVTAGGRTFHYVYTVDDERIAAIEDLGGGARKTTWTLRGLDNQLLSVWTDAAWKEDQIWRGSSLVGFRTPQGTRHYSVDHLGSPRVITSATGSLIGIQTFEPFGAGGSTGSGALQFTGHERDTANLADGTVNLPDYAHARLLDTTWGRFLSVDPAWSSADLGKPQSWNRYAYALNNPVDRVDPDGRNSFAIPPVIVGLGAAAYVCASNPQCSQRVISLVVGTFNAVKTLDSGLTMTEAAADGMLDAKDLPNDPDELLDLGYDETTHPKAAEHGRRTFENPENGDQLEFDKGRPGETGNKARDHYHRVNPKSTGKQDKYLDVNGKPVPDGSRPSHIYPRSFWQKVKDVLRQD